LQGLQALGWLSSPLLCPYITPGRHVAWTLAKTASGEGAKMVRAMAILLVCQLAGTGLQQAAGLPIPGPVIGMVLLLGLLVWRGGASPSLHGTAQGLLRYLGLLFVPAGVGFVTELPELRANAGAITIAIVVSTILGLAVTGVLMQFLLKGERNAA
jgi:holin-like protein